MRRFLSLKIRNDQKIRGFNQIVFKRKQNNSTLSTTTAGVGDVWQISNAGYTGTTMTLDRDGSGTAQDVYWVNGSDVIPFTNNPTIAFGGSLMIQAVYAGTYMIFNATGLTDA